MQTRPYAKFMQIDCLAKISWNGGAKSDAKYIATQSLPKYVSHCNRWILKRIGNYLLSIIKFCQFGDIWVRYALRVKFTWISHFEFMTILLALNADTLTHSKTNLCCAKNIEIIKISELTPLRFCTFYTISNVCR